MRKPFKEYLIEEEESNLRQKDTGLPVIVWVSAGKNLPHMPRIKIQNNKNIKIDNKNLIPITIENKPKNIENYDIDSDIFKKVSKWIVLNKEVLLQYWNFEIGTREMVNLIKKL